MKKLFASIVICLMASVSFAQYHSSSSHGRTSNATYNNSNAKLSYAVYKTPYGQKYHKYHCRYLRGKNLAKMSVKVAQRMGLDPCKMCQP